MKLGITATDHYCMFTQYYYYKALEKQHNEKKKCCEITDLLHIIYAYVYVYIIIVTSQSHSGVTLSKSSVFLKAPCSSSMSSYYSTAHKHHLPKISGWLQTDDKKFVLFIIPCYNIPNHKTCFFIEFELCFINVMVGSESVTEYTGAVSN